MATNQVVVLSALLVVVLVASTKDKPAANKAPTETAAVASGKQTYVEYCAVCHGTDGRGMCDLLHRSEDFLCGGCGGRLEFSDHTESS